MRHKVTWHGVTVHLRRPRGRPIKYLDEGVSQKPSGYFHVGCNLGGRVVSVAATDTYEAAVVLNDLVGGGWGW